MKGYFITFEGIEGVGKSTQARLLCKALKEKGYPVRYTREPGGTRIGEAIRDVLASIEYGEMHPLSEVFLFSAARVQHVEQVIRPAIEEGYIVICDRFYDATLAYQGYGRNVHLTTIREINSMAAWGCKPDLTFLLDGDPELGMSRVRRRLEEKEEVADRIERESIGFYEKVREGYLISAQEEPGRFRVLDASLEFDVLHQKILDESVKEIGRHWGSLQKMRMSFTEDARP
jgi:dTMP kinase